MKHIAVIRPFLDSMYESWMSESDKAEIEQQIVKQLGNELDRAIDQGIANGYTPQQQAAMINKIFG
jgi:hypothetical protein